MWDWIDAALWLSIALTLPVSHLLLTRPGFRVRMDAMGERRRDGPARIVESRGIPIFYATSAVWFATLGMPDSLGGEPQQWLWLLVPPAWVFAMWAHRRTAERLSHLLVEDREPPARTAADVTQERCVRIFGLVAVAAYIGAHTMRYSGNEAEGWTSLPSLLTFLALGSLVAMCWVTVQAAPAPKRTELTSWP